MSNTKYWFQDIHQITDIDKYNKVLPVKTDDYPEKVNSVVRLSIVIGLITSLINLRGEFLALPLLTMLITYFIFLGKQKKLKKMEEEKFNDMLKNRDMPFKNIAPPALNVLTTNEIDQLKAELGESDNCTPPTRDNVFMNALPYDDRKRYPACNQTPAIKAEMAAMFDTIPNSAEDIFNRNDGRYGFHTMPATTFPSDRDTFAKWTYGTGLSCKEGNGEQCYNNMYHGLHSKLGMGGNAAPLKN